MRHSVADDLATHLADYRPIIDMVHVDGSPSPLEAGVNLFIGYEPPIDGSTAANNKDTDNADIDVVTIYDTGGGMQNAGWAIDDTDVQIRCRNKGYREAYQTLNNIRLILEASCPTLGGLTYQGIWIKNDPRFIKRTERGHYIFVMNVRVVREATTAQDAGNRKLL